MYSRVVLPRGIGRITLKQPIRITSYAHTNGVLACDKINEDTWFVWNCVSGVVEAIFRMKPNVHGWSASEAHAKNYVLRSASFNPFDLDSIP